MKHTLLALALSFAAIGDTITAYCPCRKCCGQWAGSGQRTASGTVPTPGRTVAGPRSVPFGTRVHIAGVGWRVVEDRTAKRYDGRWDVFFDDHDAALRFGKREVKVTVERKAKQ